MTQQMVAAEPTFMNAPSHVDLDTLNADVAILGARYGVPYDMQGVASDASQAPAAIRQRSARYGRFVDHHDFDLGGTLYGGRDVNLVDCGDVPADPRDLEGNAAATTDAVRQILARGTVPIVLGGDDSIPALVLHGYDSYEDIHVIQIDAHLDFRDEVNGIRHGYSSPMRRASEMPWVARIVHVGLRGVGSARPDDVQASQDAGNLLIRATDVHTDGPQAVLDQLPDDGNFFITLDCDGLDPAVTPGTSAPLPGGLTFDQVATIFRGAATQGRIVGMDVAEYFQSLDVNEITGLAVTRLIANLLGTMARTGQLGR